MKYCIYIFLLIFSLSLPTLHAQEGRQSQKVSRDIYYNIRGEVKGKESDIAVKDAKIYIAGGGKTTTNAYGRFTIRGRVGDRVVIEHPSFGKETVVISDSEPILVLVSGYDAAADARATSLKRSQRIEMHKKFLDSALYFKKRDIDKSIDYIEKSLEQLYLKEDQQKLSQTYGVLGDIYLHWKQYDLAISNYRTALRMYKTMPIWLSLAKSQLLNEQYEDAIASYNTILRNNLSRYRQVLVYEGLGDAYKALKQYNTALTNYNKALAIAQKDLITPKITDLNSKIAENYAAKGDADKAEGYFKNSLNLASEENVDRAIVEQNRVADFYNKTNSYSKEIELRKKNLQELKNSGAEKKVIPDAISDSSAITSQKINYKIGNAFLLQEKYDEAIPYFKKSISEADTKEDLIVKKDATRKLSQSYESLGDFEEAKKIFEDYVEVVNKLALKKEQEISQAARFTKRIQENQVRIMSLEADRLIEKTKNENFLREQALIEESNTRQKYTIYSLIFGMSLLVITIYLLYRNSKQQKLANNLLALKSLRTQMNPHFIFNALNSVNNYIALNDERNANRYLSEFSTLMRSVLENSDEDFIPLSKEFELLEVYVRLEHMRFKDKFDYEIQVDETVKVSEFQIPPMLLQPYIENAIWHGLRYKEEKGFLKIQVTATDNDMLQIIIEDDGIGRHKSMELKTKNQLRQKSKGMGNIKKRIAILNNMYKDKVDVFISDVYSDGRGTKVILTLKKD